MRTCLPSLVPQDYASSDDPSLQSLYRQVEVRGPVADLRVECNLDGGARELVVKWTE